MATNPLVPFTDMVAGDMTPGMGDGPVGVASAASSDPALVPGMSPAMAALWAPEPAPAEYDGTDAPSMGDEDEGEDDHSGVPLPLPPLPGATTPTYPPVDSGWRDQVSPPPTGGTVSPAELAEAEGTLTPLQRRQRAQAIRDADRIDALQAEIDADRAALGNDEPGGFQTPPTSQTKAAPARRGNQRQGRIEPGWTGEREYEDDNFVSRYVKKLRGAWNRNEDVADDMGRERLEATPPPAPKPYVSDDPRMAVQVIATAADLVGMPHRWGGDSYGGADDLGVVRAAYRKAGVELPPVMDAESLPGERVKLSAMRPGDLILWHDEGDVAGNTRIGIFAGENQFITSSVRRGVTVRNMTELADKDASGRRIRRGGGDHAVSLAGRTPAEQRLAREVSDALDDVMDSLSFGGRKKRKKKSDGGGDGKRGGGKRKGGSGRSDVNDGDSWEPRSDGGTKYSGIGATK